MKLKGKIAAWFWILLLLGNIAFAYMIIYSKDSRMPLLALFLFNLILFPMVLRNYVVLNGFSITVYFGFYAESMPLKDIAHIYETSNPAAATAASLDRIVIKGTDGQMLICSVEEKERLIEALRDSCNETLRIDCK